MVVTRSLGEDTTVTARGVPEPDTQYSYAVVLGFEGPLAPLARRSAESAARDVLSGTRSVSWTRVDGGGLRLQFTRADPSYAARVTDELLSALDAALDDDRARYDDEAFDRAFAALDEE